MPTDPTDLLYEPHTKDNQIELTHGTDNVVVFEFASESPISEREARQRWPHDDDALMIWDVDPILEDEDSDVVWSRDDAHIESSRWRILYGPVTYH